MMHTNRYRRPLKATIAGLFLAIVCASCGLQTRQPTAPVAESPARSYIVQARSAEDARQAVEAVGGTITHELEVIRAVGAMLTSAQVGGLRSRDDVHRVYADATVSTASSCGIAGGPPVFEDSNFSWTITNTGSSTVTIGAVSIAWPSVNGALKKIRFDGSDIWTVAAEAPYVQIVGEWHDDVERRHLAPGQSADLMFEFDDHIDWTEANYTIFVDFQEGCSLEFKPREMDCRSNGLAFREFKDKKIKWLLPNQGTDAITVGEVSLNWPEAAGQLKKIRLGSSDIFVEYRDAPVATIADGWHTDIKRRRIHPGDEETLEIEFTADVDLDQESHSIVVEFLEGCRTEFVPAATIIGSDQKVDKKARKTHYIGHVGADLLHQDGITGTGVTVAVIDTGVWTSGGGKNWLRKDYDGVERVLRAYDSVNDVEGDVKLAEDENGHGSHVTSIILSSRKARGSGNRPDWNGVAPGVSLVSIKAFDDSGSGTYLDVIRGIDWIVRNKDIYGIRVLNLSLSAPPQSFYWDDPLNQAVMEAWRAGIVVVASAGNRGPEPMTIGVPGNVPYIITVGAMTDNRTPSDPSDDSLASFSSTGPTYEGFVKPEVVAPGGRLLGVMNKKSRIPKEHKNFHDGDSYYYMSGTSQSTAVVSGVVALLLEAEPGLTPDQVKCKLMNGARPALTPSGSLGLSLFQQGAGLVNAAAAVASAEYGCANRGLDIDADLAGERHFAGRANRDANGNYFLMGLEGFLWTDRNLWSDGNLWTDRNLWADGNVWADGNIWADAYLWTDANIWADGYIWTSFDLWADGNLWADRNLWSDRNLWADRNLWTDDLAEPMEINFWVEQE